MGHSPGERGLFRGQSPGFRWVSGSGRHPGEVVGKDLAAPTLSYQAKSWPCAPPPLL